MYLGGADHVAPGGGANGVPITSAGRGTSCRKASCVPSGDQAGALGACGPFVTAIASPVSIQRTQSWVLPPRLDAKARRVPSGDQAGESSLNFPEVSARCPDPSRFTTQMLL